LLRHHIALHPDPPPPFVPGLATIRSFTATHLQAKLPP
jgi:hypothetical protein